MKIRTLFLVGLICLTVMGMVQAQFVSADELVEIETNLSVDFVHPGSSFQAAVIANLQPTWHVNAHQPTLEYLIPTELTLESVDGLTLGETRYPESIRLKFEFAKEELDVYEGRVIMRFPVSVSPDASGERVIQGSFRYQACNNEICLAPTRK
ncbi:MAG: protein-disulfide reductase DsbD domain-containing protein, partial [Acidobacteriota bacterium]